MQTHIATKAIGVKILEDPSITEGHIMGNSAVVTGCNNPPFPLLLPSLVQEYNPNN